MTCFRSLSTALVLAAGLLFSGAASAQGAGPGAPPAGDAPAFSATELQSFATAQSEVQAITDEYQAKASAADPAEMASLQQEMAQAQVAAVQGSGLEIATYNEIAQAVQSDPALAARIAEMR